ncbi:MAG: hypothetical protein HC767_03505 [Akkermansiaceae bacterium]|nr:hypothetical protein [Akkermansiaceae bacterium]
MMTIAMKEQQPILALFAFIGGLSASTGMIIVETIALATMVSNDLMMPLLLRIGRRQLNERQDLTGLLLAIRRGTIVLVLMLGYLYASTFGSSYTLVTIGLVSFVAVLQFAPAIIIGIYWKGATKAGALAGLLGGFGAWTYTLLLPSFARSGWLPGDFVDGGPWGIALLKPYMLLGLEGLDPISHATIWTLLVNVSLLVGVSLFTTQSMIERSQAIQFVDVFKQSRGSGGEWRGRATVDELWALLERFLGAARADAALAAIEAEVDGFVAACAVLVDEHGVQLRRFPDELLAQIGTVADEVVAEVGSLELIDLQLNLLRADQEAALLDVLTQQRRLAFHLDALRVDVVPHQLGRQQLALQRSHEMLAFQLGSRVGGGVRRRQLGNADLSIDLRGVEALMAEHGLG